MIVIKSIFIFHLIYNNVKINLDNSDYFGEFIVLKELNLSLNLESIPELSKVFIEYNWEYSLEDSIKVYHYDYTTKQ